jgi:hypothetical protein
MLVQQRTNIFIVVQYYTNIGQLFFATIGMFWGKVPPIAAFPQNIKHKNIFGVQCIRYRLIYPRPPFGAVIPKFVKFPAPNVDGK